MEKEIKKEEWEVYWDHCKPIIEPAVKYQQSYTIDDIEDKIRHGFFHLWPGKNSAMITELVNLPQERVYNLLFAGGKYDEIEGIIEQIEVFARAIGCSKLMGGGRPGWHRKIKHLGFKRDFILTKTLWVLAKAKKQIPQMSLLI